jgi:cytochrome c peroxidase
MRIRSFISVLATVAIILSGSPAFAQVAVPPPGLFQMPLSQIPVPEPPNLFQFVKNKPAAIRLGKAFFWDMQVGSDGNVACATCHFSAGVDKRLKNTVNPGTRATLVDNTFQVRGPGDVLLDSDFPFHQRQSPDFQASAVTRDLNDVVGSQGVHRFDFVSIATGSAVDSGTPVTDPVFQSGGVNMRRVTARNTPSNINAIFNFSNFWDGRAHFIFNGENPFGPLDQNAGVWFNVNSVLTKQKIEIELASLASQATGPPLDDTEMSFKGRTFPQLGRKMLSLTPLGSQMVHPKDGVLGTLSRAVQDPVTGKMTGLPGLNAAYEQMIKDAFMDTLWNSPGLTTTDGFNQMEANFSLFWGLAIQLYEATLVSDQTPFDRFLGGDQAALTSQQQSGLNIFFGAGRCDLCHGGTELTNASVAAAGFITNTDHALIEQMPVADGSEIIYDNGFNNTAVRPTQDDIGRAGKSSFTNPLNNQFLPLGFSEQAELQAAGNMPFSVPILPAEIPSNFPVANTGGMKVPGLRNVELTAPYMHNGGMRTLDEVVEFYTRGGNFPADNADQLDINIVELGTLQNAADKKASLVAFMMSMTDERVRNESAPFDHPEIFIPNGDPSDPTPDALLRIAAKDADGNTAPALALTINALPSVTNKTSLVISGTKESGSAVAVKVNGGLDTAAEAPTDTTWSATITLAGGTNSITVTGTDTSSNVVTLTSSVSVIFSDGCFNCGGAVSVLDAVKALRIAVGLVTATADDLLHGDVAPLVNGVPAPDNRIDASDALVILKKAVGLISF